MENRVVFVSGASSGLGAHFAKLLVDAGARGIVLAARRMEKLRKLAETLTNSGECDALCLSMDVTDIVSIRDAFMEAEKRFGVIDVLVNCAGIGIPALALDMTPEDFDAVYRVNLRGAFFVAQEFAKCLVRQKRPGNIVMIASILGLRPSTRQSNYGAAKAALLHCARNLALELQRYDIRVNSLCPGYFPSEMTESYLKTAAGRKYISKIPPKRLGRLEELDGPLLLLASQASSFMTGTHVVVDLGHTNASL